MGRAVAEQLGHREPVVRALAAQWLANGATTWSIPHLLRALGDPSVQVRRAVMDTLAHQSLAPPAALLTPLQHCALHDGDWSARLVSASLLSRMGTVADQALMQIASSDSHAWIRSAAVEGLATRDSNGATSTLMHVVQSDPDLVVQLAAARALRTRGADVGALLTIPTLPAPVRGQLVSDD